MKKVKILIADDEELLCELYQMILESEFPCDITKVYDGESAINLIKNGSDFDLIISDFNMPKATGGELFLANKNNDNIPFLLFSGGDLSDYKDFANFKDINQFNHFFNKPFDEIAFVQAIKNIVDSKSLDRNIISEKILKIKLSFYILYTKSAAEVFIKLGDNKYTKVLNNSDDNIPDSYSLDHYRNKGIEYIYLQESGYKNFINDVYKKFNENISSEKKLETFFKIAGFNFKVSTEGLNNIGISNSQIESTNEKIQDAIVDICNNQKCKDEFSNLCSAQGMIISHSTLIIYVAAAICKFTKLPTSTVKKISIAAFFHDLSMFNEDIQFDENKINEITDAHLLKLIKKHPFESAEYLPLSSDLTDDIKRIIIEHHELPNGNGYPKGLNAYQISQLSCLFILSQEVALCLIRNNFSLDRLNDFLINSKNEYDQGNFSKFYNITKSIFSPQVINDKAI
jgi:response regulator RpfG family c-di-GMP phosphodiesterase